VTRSAKKIAYSWKLNKKSSKRYVKDFYSHVPPPRLASISTFDVYDFYRLEALYIQAAETGCVNIKGISALDWLAAACYAQRKPSQEVKYFVSIVAKADYAKLPSFCYQKAAIALYFHMKKSKKVFQIV
jgi:hypothetical protein